MFNPRERMKASREKHLDYNIHWFNLWNIRNSMFEYELPETIRPEIVEMLLATQGTCGVGVINGSLYTGVGGYCGETENFIPTEYLITNVGIGDLRGKVGKDIVVGWNNNSATPDFAIEQFADILTEIDVSERSNVQFTRHIRIPKVADAKEKAAVEGAVKAITEGKFEAIVSKNVLASEILSNGSAEDKFLDLVDVKDADKLQYLNQYRDNVIKRYFQIYGQGMQSTAKLAQQTTDELHGNDTVSMIIPIQMLEQRKKWIEEINEVFAEYLDKPCSVRFSQCWRDSVQEMEDLYTNGEPEKEPQEGDDDNGKTPETDPDS